MRTIEISGRQALEIAHVLCDYNGTLAVDGLLAEGVRERLAELARHVPVHVLTADTYGTAAAQLDGVPAEFVRVTDGVEKARFVAGLEGDCVAIGNGANDLLMMNEVSLAIGVMGPEGMTATMVGVADILVTNPRDALDLLLRPLRLSATYRR